jgi:hypothetical protein
MPTLVILEVLEPNLIKAIAINNAIHENKKNKNPV